jgi:hypothetical protein
MVGEVMLLLVARDLCRIGTTPPEQDFGGHLTPNAPDWSACVRKFVTNLKLPALIGTLIELLGSKARLHRVARELVVQVAQAPLERPHASLEV